jgi:hypothetical protein
MHLFQVYKKTLSWHKALLNISWINCSLKNGTIFILPALEVARHMLCICCALRQYALLVLKSQVKQLLGSLTLDIPLAILNFLWPILIIALLWMRQKHLFLIYKKFLLDSKFFLNKLFKYYTLFKFPTLEVAPCMSCIYCAMKQYFWT